MAGRAGQDDIQVDRRIGHHFKTQLASKLADQIMSALLAGAVGIAGDAFAVKTHFTQLREQRFGQRQIRLRQGSRHYFKVSIAATIALQAAVTSSLAMLKASLK